MPNDQPEPKPAPADREAGTELEQAAEEKQRAGRFKWLGGDALLNAYRITLGREKGTIQPLETDEVWGEHPGGCDIPCDLKFETWEITEGSKRWSNLKSWAKNNKKCVVIVSSVAGVSSVVVGSVWMMKHILDRKPEADVTNDDTED